MWAHYDSTCNVPSAHPGSITAAAMRLIPSPDKPENHIHAVDVLFRYMREKEDVDPHSLVLPFVRHLLSVRMQFLPET